MKVLIVAFLCSIQAGVCAAVDITITRVVSPEFPGEYKHPVTITELANGDLHIACYGDEGEYQGDTAIFGLRLVKGSTQASAGRPVADNSPASPLSPAP